MNQKQQEEDYTKRPWADLMYQFNLSFNPDPKDDIEDITISFDLFDNTKNLVSTLENTLKTFSIYVDSDATSHLTSDYVGQGIVYNTNSINTFNLSTGIDYRTINNETIIAQVQIRNVKYSFSIFNIFPFCNLICISCNLLKLILKPFIL